MQKQRKKGGKKKSIECTEIRETSQSDAHTNIGTFHSLPAPVPVDSVQGLIEPVSP